MRDCPSLVNTPSKILIIDTTSISIYSYALSEHPLHNVRTKLKNYHIWWLNMKFKTVT